jgi:hypothetical protein
VTQRYHSLKGGLWGNFDSANVDVQNEERPARDA